MTLRWEPQHDGKSEYAYTGNLIVGMVVKTLSGEFAWQISAVNMRWTAKGEGKSGSMEAGKRALARAWQKWLDRAQLVSAHEITAERQRCASVVLDHESIAGAIVYDLARAITKG